MALQTMDYYNKAAQDQYDPTYNERVNQLKQSIANQQLGLDSSKTVLNQNFDNQVNDQNLNNVKSKNNISNTTLGRGLANSSIVTSQLGEADQINGRYINRIGTARTNALNDVDSQKTLLGNNMEQTLSGWAGDRLSKISDLARNMYNDDWSKDFQEKQAEQQRKYQEAQLELQRQAQAVEAEYKRAMAYNSRGGSGGGSSNNELDSWTAGQAQKLKMVMDSDISPGQKIQYMRDMISDYGDINNSNYKTVAGMANQYLSQLNSTYTAKGGSQNFEIPVPKPAPIVPDAVSGADYNAPAKKPNAILSFLQRYNFLPK